MLLTAHFIYFAFLLSQAYSLAGDLRFEPFSFCLILLIYLFNACDANHNVCPTTTKGPLHNAFAVRTSWNYQACNAIYTLK